MSFYEDRILPHLTNLAMRNRTLVPYRQRVLSAADGRVLEIGIGSGLNLPFYGPDAREVIGLDPSPRLIAMAERTAQNSTLPIRFIDGSAEAIPLDDGSVDTVLTTWTLCSIQGAVPALAEMRRLLIVAPVPLLIVPQHGDGPMYRHRPRYASSRSIGASCRSSPCRLPAWRWSFCFRCSRPGCLSVRLEHRRGRAKGSVISIGSQFLPLKL